jgi:hypothetical protein
MLKIDASRINHMPNAHTSRQRDGFIAKKAALIVHASIRDPDDLRKNSGFLPTDT